MAKPIVLRPHSDNTWTYSEIVDNALLIRENPVEWCAIYLGVELWRGQDGENGQAELVEAVFGHRRVVGPSGHSTGKTWSCMVVPPLWLLSHPYSFVAVSGASWEHVRSNLFPAFHQICQKQPYLFISSPKAHVWMLDHKWGAIGFSPMRPESVQGWHSPGGTLVIVDEAAALDADIFEALSSLLSSMQDHMVLLGNPTRSEGPFADCIRSDSWHQVRLSSMSTPNCKEGRIVVPGLASVQMIRDWTEEYGQDSAEFKARVLGQLPDQGENIFISRAAVESCFDREPAPLSEDGALTMGVDVAWSETGDETVFLVRGETTIHHIETYRGMSQPEQIETIKAILDHYQGRITTVCVDATGGGAGLGPTLKVQAPEVSVVGVVGAERADDPARYANTRSECWGRMKSALDYMVFPTIHVPAAVRPGSQQREPVQVRRRLLQMSELEYYPNNRGAYQLEPKPKYKDRTNRPSPDTADALALTFGKPLGRKAFPMLHDCHKALVPPRLRDLGGSRYLLTFANLPPEVQGWPGTLSRATWISRSGPKAALWVHVDDAGSWFVLRSLSAPGPAPVRAFWEQVIQISETHAYHLDLMSGPEDKASPLEDHPMDLCAGVIRARGIRQSPTWLEPSLVGGKHGLDLLDRMFLTGLASHPDAAFWKENPNMLPADYLGSPPPPQINLWDSAAFSAIRDARMKAPPVTQTDPDLVEPEGLVADGGAIVRCLRLLAVAGAAAEHRLRGSGPIIGPQ